jgi:glycosidase
VTGTTPLYFPNDEGHIDYDTWFRAGGGWQGGTIKGLTSKLGYLRRLGITALWVSPPFRQVACEPSYHGYGVQNFLDVDPHFGTREEFRDFVDVRVVVESLAQGGRTRWIIRWIQPVDHGVGAEH